MFITLENIEFDAKTFDFSYMRNGRHVKKIGDDFIEHNTRQTMYRRYSKSESHAIK
jgi:hypothetical protein